MKSYSPAPRQTTPRRPVVAATRHGEAQRAALGQALGHAMQAKLVLGTPADPCEREADAVADRVLAMNAASVERVQRTCRACDDDELGRRSVAPSLGGQRPLTEAPALASEALRTEGRPLPASARQFMAARFACDFGAVRVHRGTDAARAAQAVQARAYTVGRDIVFAAGEDDFASVRGRRLLAHELTHVVQQGAARVDGLIDEAAIDEAAIAVDGPACAPGATMETAPILRRENAARPPTIRVVANHQYPLTSANVSAGLHSGNGGVSEMEVSNGADNFNGQRVSEVFVGGSGDNPTVGGCNNASGQGGQGGSTFTIGDAVSFSHFGININLPAKANTFYDMHIKAFRANVLPAGVSRNYSSCLQQYTMGGTTLNGGQVFNRLHNITRTTVGGQDCANIDLSKS